MKKLIILTMLIVVGLCSANSLTGVSSIDGNALHAMQSAWEIADSENSGDTQATALAVTERTKLLLDAAIAAASSGDDNISVLAIPSKWSRIRMRALGITNDGTRTDQIYLGSLGGRKDTELSHSGQLAWVIGTQQSIYDQIAFTSGGTYEPQPGDVVTGNTSGETAVVVSKVDSASTWSAGTAAGTITYKSASGAFTSGETIKIVNPRGITQANVLTHAASDLIDFELADACVITAKTGIWVTAVSPADNTNAEAEIDVKGADFLVILTSATSADSKLLIKGY
ncbi:hypothetical protein LCGC14_1337940 [marine sediment metagenome]|uniref:Uncharacterized protein n=1 Tax=marine sediment metagenome TaxID=412755 RepID=A0A0F9NGU8_9ZZZZ